MKYFLGKRFKYTSAQNKILCLAPRHDEELSCSCGRGSAVVDRELVTCREESFGHRKTICPSPKNPIFIMSPDLVNENIPDEIL
jgi:hypothetical protein